MILTFALICSFFVALLALRVRARLGVLLARFSAVFFLASQPKALNELVNCLRVPVHLHSVTALEEVSELSCLEALNSTSYRTACQELQLQLQITFCICGNPLLKLEAILSICMKGCQKIRDAVFLEDIQ